VEKRADKPRSQWAAVKGKLDSVTASPTAYTIWRVTSADVSTLELKPLSDAVFDELSTIDVRDIDGDGVDDALVAASWLRVLSGKVKVGEVTSVEHVSVVYVVGGAQLALGAQHATAYKTETNLDPGENPQAEETIAFTYAIVPGPPLVLHVAVGSSEVLPKDKRVKGLLDPKRDPWLKAADLPIAFTRIPGNGSAGSTTVQVTADLGHLRAALHALDDAAVRLAVNAERAKSREEACKGAEELQTLTVALAAPDIKAGPPNVEDWPDQFGKLALVFGKIVGGQCSANATDPVANIAKSYVAFHEHVGKMLAMCK
jgi:hypothetical protein